MSERSHDRTDDPVRYRIGRNLRRERLARGLTQEELAELLGIHRSFLPDLEAGERSVTRRTVEELARRLDMDPPDLVGEEGQDATELSVDQRHPGGEAVAP